MTRARVDPVLVTGATGRVGRAVVAQLLAAGVPVRALTRRPTAADLPAAVEIVAGDLTLPESLDAALEDVSSVFLVWTAPPTFEELTPEEFRRETAGSWPRAVVDMLLAAWKATIGHPALVTSTVSDVVGSPPRTFRQWAADHSAAFLERPASHEI